MRAMPASATCFTCFIQIQLRLEEWSTWPLDRYNQLANNPSMRQAHTRCQRTRSTRFMPSSASPSLHALQKSIPPARSLWSTRTLGGMNLPVDRREGSMSTITGGVKHSKEAEAEESTTVLPGWNGVARCNLFRASRATKE